MQIEIKPDDIDQYVKDAIMKSTVGQSLCVEIDRGIQDLMKGYNSPIKNFMNKVLENFVKEYMERPEIKEMVMQAIIKTITPQAIEAIVIYGIEKLNSLYKDA
jgi:hypothetical protein